MSDYYTRENVLNTLVAALGDRESALDIKNAYNKTGDDGAIARFVDAFLCAGQDNGTLDAEDYFGSESWLEAVDAVFPEDENEEDGS